MPTIIHHPYQIIHRDSKPPRKTSKCQNIHNDLLLPRKFSKQHRTTHCTSNHPQQPTTTKKNFRITNYHHQTIHNRPQSPRNLSQQPPNSNNHPATPSNHPHRPATTKKISKPPPTTNYQYHTIHNNSLPKESHNIPKPPTTTISTIQWSDWKSSDSQLPTTTIKSSTTTHYHQ